MLLGAAAGFVDDDAVAADAAFIFIAFLYFCLGFSLARRPHCLFCGFGFCGHENLQSFRICSHPILAGQNSQVNRLTCGGSFSKPATEGPSVFLEMNLDSVALEVAHFDDHIF